MKQRFPNYFDRQSRIKTQIEKTFSEMKDLLSLTQVPSRREQIIVQYRRKIHILKVKSKKITRASITRASITELDSSPTPQREIQICKQIDKWDNHCKINRDRLIS